IIIICNGRRDSFTFEREGICSTSADFVAAFSETENNGVSPKSGEKRPQYLRIIERK
ncbi:hypothetical protein KI387_036106, partial [Taxus chinensis]